MRRVPRCQGGVAPNHSVTPSARTVPGLQRPGTVPVWALKLTAVATVINVFFFGLGYAQSNAKTSAAPLQPPVVTSQVTPAPTPAPALTLRRGVRTSQSAPLTSTRHS